MSLRTTVLRAVTRADHAAAQLATATQLAGPAAPGRASVDTGTVRDRFNWEWATNPDSFEGADTYWWWAASIRVDPDEVIAEDDEGNLWSVPFTTDGEDSITFGIPLRVRETFVPVQAAAGAAATFAVGRQRQRVAAFALERPTKPDPTAASADPTTEESAVNPAVRALLVAQGLDPDAATDAQIQAATVLATPDENPDAPDTTDGEPVEGHDAEGAEADTPATPEPVAAGSQTVTISAGRLAALEAQAAEGATARSEQIRVQRDALCDAAVADGRITPAERQGWRDDLDAAPDVTARRLGALTAGRGAPIGQIARDSAASASAVSPEKRSRVRASLGIKTSTSKEA